MIVDVHAHYLPKNFSDFMGDCFFPRVGVRSEPVLRATRSRTRRKTSCRISKAAFTCAPEAFGAGHLVTGSDYPVLQDYEVYKQTFAYIGRLGLPQADVDQILHHNAQQLFGFNH